MIRRYIFGNPIETEAVLEKTEAVFTDSEKSGGAKIPHLACMEGGALLRCTLAPEDIVYGLGEQVRGINKRGWIYESNCSDNPNHQEDCRSLYGAHNFLIVAGQECFGVFVDTPAKVSFDVGYTCSDEMTIRVEDGDYELYVLDGGSAGEIVHEFRTLISRSYLPPRWAFGYGQSRWSYNSSDEVREVARQFRENHLPIDMIYLDIDYMERYKDFTVNPETFADFPQLVQEMKEQHIHVVPIIDGGVKIEEGYDVYEEGVANGYFCKDGDGKDFVVGVWPGKCHFPDMLNDEARRWFGQKYKILMEQGIEGFWNDMNEPAIFYSEKRLNEVFEKLQEYQGQNLNVDTFFGFRDLVNSLANNPQDYASFYHNYRGTRVRHDKVHNLFGYYMTRSAAEAFEELEPERRTLLFSRASYIGMHRYGGIWMGDNKSWWSHLKMNLQMLPSLNMCGFLYTGSDLGGFGSDATRDLVLRWLALGIFMPLLRNHSAAGTRRQEPYQFGDTEEFRGLLGLRYRLLPYLYSEFMKAALKDEMYARPLGFVWPQDAVARRTEDQLLIGESIMIAPVCEQNADGRVVYLPEAMKLIRFCGTQVTEEKILEKGHHYVTVGLGEVVVFLRKGHILPLSEGGEYADEADTENLELYGFADGEASYELYTDDGVSRTAELEGNISVLRCK